MLPSFDEAVAQFQNFLEARGYPRQLAWISPKDVLLTGERLVYLRIATTDQNWSKPRQEYAAGVASGLGVKLSSFCNAHGRSFCFVWHPANREEAVRNLMPADGSLKLSVVTSQPECRPISNPLVWHFLKFWHRRRQAMADELFS